MNQSSRRFPLSRSTPTCWRGPVKPSTRKSFWQSSAKSRRPVACISTTLSLRWKRPRGASERRDAGRRPYEVVYSIRVQHQIVALGNIANRRGDGDAFAEAFTELQRRLRIYPQFGEQLV